MQKVIFPALSKSYIFSSDAFSKKLNKPRSKAIQHTYLISVTLFMLDTKIAPGRYRVIHINNILEIYLILSSFYTGVKGIILSPLVKYTGNTFHMKETGLLHRMAIGMQSKTICKRTLSLILSNSFILSIRFYWLNIFCWVSYPNFSCRNIFCNY